MTMVRSAKALRIRSAIAVREDKANPTVDARGDIAAAQFRSGEAGERVAPRVDLIEALVPRPDIGIGLKRDKSAVGKGQGRGDAEIGIAEFVADEPSASCQS